jgi:hypothetical protein
MNKPVIWVLPLESDDVSGCVDDADDESDMTMMVGE